MQKLCSMKAFKLLFFESGTHDPMSAKNENALCSFIIQQYRLMQKGNMFSQSNKIMSTWHWERQGVCVCACGCMCLCVCVMEVVGVRGVSVDHLRGKAFRPLRCDTNQIPHFSCLFFIILIYF